MQACAVAFQGRIACLTTPRYAACGAATRRPRASLAVDPLSVYMTDENGVVVYAYDKSLRRDTCGSRTSCSRAA